MVVNQHDEEIKKKMIESANVEDKDFGNTMYVQKFLYDLIVNMFVVTIKFVSNGSLTNVNVLYTII